VIDIPVVRIRPSRLQPRSAVGHEPLVELEASIREHGVLQPILVRPVADRPGDYELIAGERRWRAASAAGLSAVPAIVRQMDDREALEAALVENLQREDLNPVERARAYRRLQDEFGMTQEQVATRVGRSQSSVANTMRILALPAEIQAAVEAGRISEGHARALLTVGDHRRMLELWRRVEARGLSVRATEAAAKLRGISREIPRGERATRDLDIIKQSLSESLGTPVRVHMTRSGKAGEIRIAFFSGEEFDRLVELLTGGQPR
jgi:ParB family chromosome partitioning protein